MVLLDEEVDMFYYYRIVDNYYYILVEVSTRVTELIGFLFTRYLLILFVLNSNHSNEPLVKTK